MSEYREALQNLIDAINFFCPNQFDRVQSFTDAKALLARPHIDWEGRYRFLIENRESVEPAAAEKARELFTLDEWHEEDGAVLWWKFPIEEPPYVGSPLYEEWDEDAFEHYYTHWTRIPVPSPPAATGEKCVHDLQLPNHTINVLGPLDAVCKVCKEEWDLPGDQP